MAMWLALIWFLISGVLVLSGIGWWVTSWFMYRGIDAGFARSGIEEPGGFVMTLGFWIMQWGAPLLLVGLGAIFGLVGVRTLVVGQRKKALGALLQQRGVPAEGVITYLDRNYSLLVKNRPIYSIVEYRFQDQSGAWHTKRLTDMNTDIVIRQGWQVGSTISLVYLPEDPSKNGVVVPA